MQNIKIEYLNVNSLKPYEKNTRKHKDLDVKNIATSIEKYGFNDAIGIWGKDNIIVEGHGRLLAAKKLGMKEVPCVRLDHLTDEQRREYAIAHNATTELSNWDKTFLGMELEELDLSEFDFDFVVDDIEKDESEKPEMEFTEVLGEEHNYIVLYFDNEVDWIQAESLFDLKPKLNLSTRKDGKITKGMEAKSIGRVLRGQKLCRKFWVISYENFSQLSEL